MPETVINTSICYQSMQCVFSLHASFQLIFFFKFIFSGIYQSECQTVCIQIRPEILTSMVMVQAVCKGDKLIVLVL